MRSALDSLSMHCNDVAPIENFAPDDISKLLLRSYENTVDWIEGSTHQDARDAIEGVIEGGYGEFQPRASGLLLDEKALPVSGILCSIYENEPFIVFTFTDPLHTNKGLARKLIRHASAQFLSLGFSSMHLYVTANNPAFHLYKNLGFNEE